MDLDEKYKNLIGHTNYSKWPYVHVFEDAYATSLLKYTWAHR